MTTERKGYHDRAVRALRELRYEKARFGSIRDGSGRRYRVGVYFLLAGEHERAEAAFEWCYREFPDDAGEPVFHLYGVLSAHRNGRADLAQSRLLDALVSNIFLLPSLTGQVIDAEGIWRSSNWADEAYLRDVAEFLDEPTPEERAWIAAALSTNAFRSISAGYIDTYRQLAVERDYAKRRAILANWNTLQGKCRTQVRES